MEFILLMYIINSPTWTDSGVETIQQEFYSMNSCQNAGNEFKSAIENNKRNVKVIFTCSPK